ncbi:MULTISPECIES: tyrosinase family oxidase copper chaperone [unclassified Streptomyces]|uniref:apotyrosinase chaperone MelC1 n=1 Tax=unclassified Streptomyces TaxID=2593676 RepID=UPI002252FEC3|nr:MULTISPECIES: tyrosinase family oxidase copper chaperone [unclassified Streptomyces]MCX4529713.1 tyrosinase cofactor [Streptomyces sp. NBC_01551]MCX4539716.1 tyrosinase cofactor [Streptomyces sp. NBC_01565]
MNKITRRQALGTTAGTLSALGLLGAAAHSAIAASPAPAPAAPAGTVDEVYQGRRIQISVATGGGHHGGHHGGAGLPTVRIDGRELHVMRNADGTWISVVNHYETFADPTSLARAAVRELQGAQLAPFAPMGGAA